VAKEVELDKREQANETTGYTAPAGQSHRTHLGGILEVVVVVLFGCVHVKFGLEKGRI
jgi:uncharacterized RmlC-like cupin family protein